VPTLTAIPDILALLDSLDNHLAYRTFFVGHNITAADFIIWGSIKGGVISQVVDVVASDSHQLHQNLLGFLRMGSSMFIFFGGCLT
jgi:glutamyl-tRNA synthetase